ncbi:Periplasmic pH-dependent serine endoprotease DegQ precursor [Hartmannibacter diazotrophicus]|uniref:Periplasmic pH-dependent serine endoprotease DegQ n=1 Tax=Hartmannibacter diazotrophicus TaxID=1482074 RepID=A0A2C9D6W8_9HYPH|nr:Do family serine endopeptidase [Hartmannibacter diazotrophicus]SON56047.1 Periplasmic pH-dependent serine endoprotease DegQ precursor [Hartmannibacter diazotrophicus]
MRSRVLLVSCLAGSVVLAASSALLAEERQVPQTSAEIQLSFAPVVKKVAPAVVNVYATREVQQQRSPLFDDPFFRRFFGGNGQVFPPQRRQQNSLGSGVIVDPSGVIITNAHVIIDDSEVKVALADRREFECDVVLKDKDLDLAVLKIRDPKGELPFAQIGESDSLEVGDIVLAIGNPFGVGQTVTQGIVSALARTRVGVADYQYFIQTDAAINPGNSGGALVNMSGQVVGINTAIYSRGGGSNGIGFAIPSDMVKVVLDSARHGDQVKLPSIGADLQPVTAQIAESLGLDRPSGLLIASIDPGGPAEKVGLEPGDRIVSLDGEDVSDPRVFNYRLATIGVGKVAKLVVDRDGQTMAIDIRLQAPKSVERPSEVRVSVRGPFTGTTIADMTPAIAQSLGLPRDEARGVIIAEVDPRSQIARVGFQPGDVILSVNGDDIGSTQDFLRAAGQQPLLWRVTINRRGRIIRLAFR